MMLRGKQVAFFSVSYSPEHAGIGPYAAAAAERLAAAGAKVRVVAGLPHYPSWRVARRDRWRLRRSDVVNGIPVTRLRQIVPRRHTALSRGIYELSFLLHGLLTRTVHLRPDLVVAVVPSLAGGLLANQVARWHGVPLVLIVQDLTAAGARQSGIFGGRLASRGVGAVEARLFRSAQAVGLVHDSFAQRCLALGVAPERLHLVPNWSRHDRADPLGPLSPGLLTPDGWQERFVALHAGNMGFKQGLNVVVECAQLAHRRGHDDLLFVLLGDGNRRSHLVRLAGELPTLHIVDPVDEPTFVGMLATADLGLVTQRSEVHDMSAPSKLTAYFNAGLPVVGSVAADCGAASEIRRSGAGILVEPQDADALLCAVLGLRADAHRSASLSLAGRVYSRDHLSSASALDRVVALAEAGLAAPA